MPVGKPEGGVGQAFGCIKFSITANTLTEFVPNFKLIFK